MSDTPTISRVAIDTEAHRKLKILAELDKRTLAGEVEFLIERELESKNAPQPQSAGTQQP